MKHFPLLAALLVWATGCAHMDTRGDFLRVIDHRRAALAPVVEAAPPASGLAQFHFSFCSDASNRVPGILLKSEKFPGPRPVVIALHGTGGGKQNMVALCRKLAGRGFIAVAIDGRYHGERKTGKGQRGYDDAIVRAWHGSGEHPLYYDTVWDVMRLVDYLHTRDDVDPQRIGLIGISKGGIETYLAAAADERIAVAVSCLGVQSFHWALAHDGWRGRIGTVQNAFDAVVREAGVTQPESPFVKQFYARVAPGIAGEFDGPQMLRCIAPRPLLVINSDCDSHTPLPGVNETVDSARQAYASASAPGNFSVIIQKNTGHQMKPESERAAIEWFVRWLKP